MALVKRLQPDSTLPSCNDWAWAEDQWIIEAIDASQRLECSREEVYLLTSESSHAYTWLIQRSNALVQQVYHCSGEEIHSCYLLETCLDLIYIIEDGLKAKRKGLSIDYENLLEGTISYQKSAFGAPWLIWHFRSAAVSYPTLPKLGTAWIQYLHNQSCWAWLWQTTVGAR